MRAAGAQGAWGTHTAHCPLHSAGPKGLRLGSVAAGHHHQRHAPGGKQGGQAAQQQQPAATKPHIANRIIEDTPPIYIPTVEEAAAIERRNYLTFGAKVRCACGLASAAALSGAPGARLSGRIHVCLGETRVAVQPVSCRAASGTSLPDLAPAGTLLAAVGAAYYTFWQRNKPEVGGAAAAGLVWQAAPGCNSCHGPFLTRTWQRGSCLGGSTGSRRSRPGRPPESQVLSPVPARRVRGRATGEATAGAAAAGQLERDARGDSARAVPAGEHARAGVAGGAGARGGWVGCTKFFLCVVVVVWWVMTLPETLIKRKGGWRRWWRRHTRRVGWVHQVFLCMVVVVVVGDDFARNLIEA